MDVSMTKIMLVEDDKSLREIYGVRLVAEGYEIISAGNGEEALALAVKDQPDLILSDVMMPKISGFDMLDILRSTPETKDIKVIMMTALSSEDQRTRGQALGANRYLVKSQVGIEDVVRTIHDVLADVPAAAAPTIQRFGVPAQSASTSSQPVFATPRPTATPSTPPPTTPPTASAPLKPPVQTVPTITPIPPAPNAPITPIPKPPTPYATATPAVNPVPPLEQKAEPAFVRSPEYDPQPVSTLPLEPVTPPAPPVAPTAPVPLPVVSAPTPPPPASIPVTAPTAPPAAAPDKLPEPTAPFSTSAPTSLGDRMINPITPVTPTPDMAILMSQELHDGSDTTSTVK